MDPEVKSTDSEILNLTRENNVLLKKIVHQQKLAQIYKAIYWAIILLITFGGLVFIQPYLNSMIGYYGAIAGEGVLNNTSSSGTSIPDLKHLQDLLNQVQGE